MKTLYIRIILIFFIALLSGCNEDGPTSKIVVSNQNITSANFSIDGKILVLNNINKETIIWDLNEKNKKFTLDRINEQNIHDKLLITHDNKKLFMNNKHILESWNLDDGSLISKFATSGIISDYDVNYNGEKTLISFVDNTLQLLNNIGQLSWKIQYNSNIQSISLSSDSIYAMISSNISNDLWVIEHNKIQYKLENSSQPYLNDISLQNKYIFMASILKPAYIYDLHSGKQILELKPYSFLPSKLFKNNFFQIKYIKFSKDTSRLLIVTKQNKIIVWELITGSLLKKLYLPNNESINNQNNILSATFTKDNNFVQAITSNGIIYKWKCT